MDKLFAAAQFYKDTLLNRKFRLKAAKKGKCIEIDIVFAASNFMHLIGLNKLTDIPGTQNKTSAQLLRDILNNRINYDGIAKSKYFSQAEQRIEYFQDLYKALNGTKMMLKSQFGKFGMQITADFMVTNSDVSYGYAHFFMKKDDEKGYTVPVTYIIHPDNYYFKSHAERWNVYSVEEVT